MELVMDCFCCRENVATGRQVKLRGDVRKGFQIAHLDEAGYIAYQEDTTYRSSFVCESCYGVLDSSDGTGTIQGSSYGIAGASRGNKAPVYTAEKYEAYRLRQARKHGLVDG
jgi:hypothetical protein